MQELFTRELSELVPADALDARDCLQLLLIEYGDTHIDTLAQLFDLTNRAELRFPHIYVQRWCSPAKTVNAGGKEIRRRHQPV